MMSDDLLDALQSVTDEVTFIRFIEALQADRVIAEETPESPDGFQGEWANQSISSFLEASLAWANGSDFGSRPGPKPSNPWALCANFLYGGKIYE